MCLFVPIGVHDTHPWTPVDINGCPWKNSHGQTSMGILLVSTSCSCVHDRLIVHGHLFRIKKHFHQCQRMYVCGRRVVSGHGYPQGPIPVHRIHGRPRMPVVDVHGCLVCVHEHPRMDTYFVPIYLCQHRWILSVWMFTGAVLVGICVHTWMDVHPCVVSFRNHGCPHECPWAFTDVLLRVNLFPFVPADVQDGHQCLRVPTDVLFA